MFKKMSLLLSIVLSIFIFNACSSTASFIPPELEGSPKWVMNPSMEGSMASMGSAPTNAGGDFSFQRNQAIADARNNMATQMKVKVSTMIKSFKAATGAKADATFDQSATQVSKQIASNTLVGSKTKDVWINKFGTMFVLLTLDTEAVIEQMDKAIKTSMGNEKAVYQKFLAKRAQDDLAKELEEFKKN